MGNQIKIGWAWTDITPRTPVQLTGQYHERIAEQVHDPLTATALVLEGADGEQAIIVSCDLLYIPTDFLSRVRTAVASLAPGLDVRKILISATHTHTAPNLVAGFWYPDVPDGVVGPAEAQAYLTERLAPMIARAWENRQPGGISWALGRAAVGHNRRMVYADGSAAMYGASDRPDFMGLEGGEDHGLELLYTWTADGALTGVVVNIGCPSQIVGGRNFVSADFWHEARKALRAKVGQDLFVLPQASAVGDQCPPDHVRKRRTEAYMWDEPGLPIAGGRVAKAVLEMLPEARSKVQYELPLAHVVKDIILPAAIITRDQAVQAQRSLEERRAKVPAQRGSGEAGFVRYYEILLDRYAHQTAWPQFGMELHVLRVGEVAFCTNPFELFLDYGLRIKARSKAWQTFVVQLTGGIKASPWLPYAGYLPTARAVAGGGYSGYIGDYIVGPEGGQVLVEQTVEAINALWADEPK